MGNSIMNNRGYTDPLPAVKSFTITPSDSNDQLASTLPNSQTPRSIAFRVYVGTTGNVSVICAQDTTATIFVGVPAGTVLPVLVTRVKSTSTTASNLVGLY